jgi:branched-chain amino acid transport system ATP-binding protein
VKRLNAQGISILLVEQRAQAALRIAERGYVLETGRIVLADAGARLLDNEDVRRAYLGI